jgi:hypothetical protein
MKGLRGSAIWLSPSSSCSAKGTSNLKTVYSLGTAISCQQRDMEMDRMSVAYSSAHS